MFQLLKKFQIFLFFCWCYVQQVGGNDFLHVNGIEGRNLTVAFTLKTAIETNERVNMYRDGKKIHTFNLSNGSCFSSINHTGATICISHVSPRNISLTFTHLLHSGVYYLAVVMPEYVFEESNKVNLTVSPAKYTTSYTAAASLNITPFQKEQPGKKFSMMIFVSVLFVVMMLVIVLLGLFYWNYRKKKDKTPALNAPSAAEVNPVPDVPCVEYCVLEFPNRPRVKVRSTEVQVEYSPIVFPLRKTLEQDNEIKSATKQNKTKMTTLPCEVKETNKVSEKAETSQPKHRRWPKKSHPITSCQIPKTQV